MKAPRFQCRFVEGGWDRQDWWPVRSPRWNHEGRWVQEGDHIRNHVPEHWDRDELVEGGPGAGETYTSMVHRHPREGPFEVVASMSFDHRMAPLIVMAAEPENDGSGRKYREHCEVVLFDAGVNVWMHRFEGGAPHWWLAAYWRFSVAPNTMHSLRVRRCAQELDIRQGGRAFGCHLAALPETVYLGITACEGINRFFEFEIIDV